jgi:hypothetical protein
MQTGWTGWWATIKPIMIPGASEPKAQRPDLVDPNARVGAAASMSKLVNSTCG